jgi:adenylate cyclase
MQASATHLLIGSEDKPTLSNIKLNGDSTVLFESEANRIDHLSNERLVLDFRHRNIRFELSDTGLLEFQFFLKGLDKKWSPWQSSNYKEYTNLSTGKYSFQARLRDLAGNVSNIFSFDFRVLPMWYFSRVAVSLYFILFFLIIWASYNQLNLRFARKQYMLEQIINKRTEDLIIEKEKTETLLANVLPKNTANEIMSKGKATKIKYNFVTVLFSDIQGFTKIAEEMNPEVLIDELDKFFFHFDSVVEKFGIEKIKTIGDAYMCAGGIPEKNRTNPVEVILAALEMQAYMKNLKEASETNGLEYWDIRIGIHTGTVVAGVVGQKKLSYDIWGDTVNTASRMDSAGAAGKINISGTTFEFVRDFFLCEYRGRMPVKYKGELDMYFVTGIIPELRDENNGPNRKFILKMQMIKLQDIEEVITKIFDDEASPNLYFHNTTLLKSISNQVELLARAEKVPEEEYVTLKLASIFLLSGFISDYEKPMEASLRLVEEILPKYGFDKTNIEATKKTISNLFNNTRESLSDKILHDARYDYMGRVDFIRLSDKLRKERTEHGKPSESKIWIEIQSKQLIEHDFITDTAKLLRSVTIEDQIAELQANNG